MAENLKNFFGRRVIESLAEELAAVHPAFKKARFVSESLDGLDSLELLARGWHIAEAMKRHLPADFPAAAKVLRRSLGPEIEDTPQSGMEVFRYLPHVLYVSKYGLDHFNDAMGLQYELTKRFTAEFSIRAYLINYPDQAYESLRQWASDPNVHVRRLVSEGSRPRLPWAPRLRAFQEDPSRVVALLELLKDDAELYVRRSVANSLYDIAKDHPDVTVDVCRRWLKDATPERKWIVNHALRSLVKRGHSGAMKLLGVGSTPKVRLGAIRFSTKTVRMGGKLGFSFEVVSASRSKQDVLIDFAVHFVKANGSTSRKVFKLKRLELQPGGRVLLTSTVSFKEMTTRQHYPGTHRIEALINGRAFPMGVVRLIL